MRKRFPRQRRLDAYSIPNVPLSFECRDEIIPVLAALQHVYSQPKLQDTILQLIANDVNQDSRDDRGWEGTDYWQILVLASVRLGCNLDCDELSTLSLKSCAKWSRFGDVLVWFRLVRVKNRSKN